MPAAKYVATRSDGKVVGKTIREIIRLMLEEGMPWYKAADAVGLGRERAYRALHKGHVIQYRREQRAELIDRLSMRVPHKLNELMDSENQAAAVRATLALEELAQQGRGEPSRRIQTGGIVIVLGGQQNALPGQAAPVTIEHVLPLLQHDAADDDDEMRPRSRMLPSVIPGGWLGFIYSMREPAECPKSPPT